jgi:hypothetical protein
MISVVPGGTLQFFDVPFRLEADDFVVQKLSRSFYEYPDEEQGITTLMPIEFDQASNGYVRQATGEQAVDPNSSRPVRTPTYDTKGDKALEVYLKNWVPLPLFRADHPMTDGVGGFAGGPTNWVRAYVEPLTDPDEDGNTHVLVLAFDTRMEPALGEDHYSALDQTDENQGAEFALAYHIRDNSNFLVSDWVREWLKDLHLGFLCRKQAEKGRKVRYEDIELQFRCEHYALYLTFLETLYRLKVVPRVKVVNTRRNVPIDVDLILDVGNSRTCGMLVETRPDENTSLNDSYRLELRNLSSPSQRYRDPFESRLEFSLAGFGDPKQFSRDSGRRSAAFSWPTVVRVGPEAGRLAVYSRSAEGRTGMSSPKRYLWDEAPRTQEWRLNAGTDDPEVREQPVNVGDYVGYVNEEGIPVDCVDDPQLNRPRHWPDPSEDPVIRPVFSRSSLMMFMLSEIFTHALVTINSPENRSKLAQPDVPRRLRRIILTMPPAMPIAERKIFLRWAQWAVDTLWQSLEWDEIVDDDDHESQDFRRKPTFYSDVDEASATQVVYLYNQIVDRFNGDVSAFFRLLGRTRPGFGDRESLRIASIDIGGGTTDLIITTYQRQGDGATANIDPTQEFREGFKVAGDDILRAVIETHVLRQFQRQLSELGVPNAEGLVNELFGEDRSSVSEERRTLRSHFANQVALPFGLKILEHYENYDSQMPGGNQLLSFGDVFTSLQAMPSNAVLDYVDDTVRKELAKVAGGDPEKQATANEFTVRDLSLNIDHRQVDHTVRDVIAGILKNLGELVQLYDCDLLLLSGRPTKQPGVRAALLAHLPLPADRVVSMHRYRVGGWYPFRSRASGEIGDPKTTAAMGALLCQLAEGAIDYFSFFSYRLKPKSTARFIGQMEKYGEIKSDKLLFSDVDLDGRDEIDMQAFVEFTTGFMIGFRQLAAERWTATPFYRIGFASQEASARARGLTPYQVPITFVRQPNAEVDENRAIASGLGDVSAEGVFRIEEADVVNRNGGPVRRGDLELRLQTMLDDDGHWLDTGSFFSS